MYLKKLLPYMKPYWKIALLGPIFMMVEVVMDLSQPWFMQRIIDIGIAQKDLAFVLNNWLLMLLLAILGFSGGIICVYFSTRAALNFSTDLRKDLFIKVQSFSFGNLDRLETGPLITRLTNDITQVQNITIMLLRMLIRAPIMLIGSIIMAIITSPQLAPILIIIVPLLVFILFIMIKKNYPLFYKVQQGLDRLNVVIQENLAGVRVVKAFVRSDYEVKKFTASNIDYMKFTMHASRMISLTMPLLMLSINLGITAALWVGGNKLQMGAIQVGQIIAFINYLMLLLTSLMIIGMLIILISRAEASAKRINETLVEKANIENSIEAVQSFNIKGEVVFDNVTFSYSDTSSDPVLKNISFAVKPGETIGILGATGSGKSTLVQLIPRLYEVDSGKILIDGKDIREINKDTLRKQIGLVLQNTILFTGTIKDNLLLGKPDATDSEIITAAKMAQAHEFIQKLPQQYEAKLKQRGVNLSGGQKQRLSIARALIRKPAILILDDSTSAVDAKLEALLQKALKEFSHITTTFVVSQKISSVIESDKIIVLDNGVITAIGSHNKLLKTSEIYRDIYKSQLGEDEIFYA